MTTKNDVKDKQGLQKVRQLVHAPKIVMLSTKLYKIPFKVCPMTLLQIDEQGDLWFLTSKNSQIYKDIAHDNRVQILYVDDVKDTYVSIFGYATHIIDEKKLNELWNPVMSKWFEGKHDDRLVLLNVDMEIAYYWDSELNKLISFFELTNGNAPEVDQKDYLNSQSY